MGPQRTSTEDIVASYRETGSVWKAGKKLGLTGQSVHERLVAVGYPMQSRTWTEEEQSELRVLVGEGVPLSEIAGRLGRPYAGVACQASRLNIHARTTKNKHLPRGAGWDKTTTVRHMKALQVYDGPVTRYARANGLSVELFVRALQLHCPERWDAYVQEHADLPWRSCDYCGDRFLPINKKQIYCARRCGDTARADRSYFGGRRRETVGLASKTCQLCNRIGVKGLSSHHVLGKDNDPENAMLIALCQGCHKAVTFLASRAFVDDEAAWEALVSLAWFRKHGPKIASGEIRAEEVLHVTVDIDLYIEDDLDDWIEDDIEALT